jgi:hypothetical protein
MNNALVRNEPTLSNFLFLLEHHD